MALKILMFQETSVFSKYQKTSRHRPIMYKSGLILISLNLLQYVSGQADGNPHVGFLDGTHLVFIFYI